nr:3-oxoacyl-[acyl-carrier-protein] synthase III C-terminal domain-containing protein [Candidatus Acidoferrales bacterium]
MTAKLITSPAELLSPRDEQSRWDTVSAGAPISVSATATALPEHVVTIGDVKAYLNKVFPLSESRTSMMLEVIQNAKVDKRYFIFPPDYTIEPRSLEQTTKEYQEHSVKLGRQVAADCLKNAGLAATDIDLLITISCTGVIIPSLDAYLINDLGFRSDVRRLPITELGCAAGAAALGRAWDFLKGVPEGNVLIVSVELPSLTFQRRDMSPANLISTILFGDGAAAAVVSRGNSATPSVNGASHAGNGNGDARAVNRPRILGTRSHLFPQSIDAMGFDLKEGGLHIVLSKDVPQLIRDKIKGLVEGFLASYGLQQDDMAAFVLHPGGQKLLLFIEEELGLPRAMTQYSWDVLRDYGNLSSASVIYVLQEWMTRGNVSAGEYGLLTAFGPGFSAEMMLLQWT